MSQSDCSSKALLDTHHPSPQLWLHCLHDDEWIYNDECTVYMWADMYSLLSIPRLAGSCLRVMLLKCRFHKYICLQIFPLSRLAFKLEGLRSQCCYWYVATQVERIAFIMPLCFNLYFIIKCSACRSGVVVTPSSCYYQYLASAQSGGLVICAGIAVPAWPCRTSLWAPGTFKHRARGGGGGGGFSVHSASLWTAGLSAPWHGPLTHAHIKPTIKAM